MANRVLLKKSNVVAKSPLTTDLEYGELALNYADGKLYFKGNGGTTIKHFPSADLIAANQGDSNSIARTFMMMGA